jgi:hypothetical protein
MLYAAVIRWSVFVITSPIRLIAGEEAHVATYNGSMRIIGAIALITFISFVIVAIAGRG